MIIMEITETRKAIIELIEPYMNKALSEWCLVIWVDWDDEFMKIYDWWSTDYIIDTIWHYDITAVFKYIWKSNWILTWKYSLHFDDENHYIEEKSTSKIYKIPSKPLHLFTEEEDENLLDLLLKLK